MDYSYEGLEDIIANLNRPHPDDEVPFTLSKSGNGFYDDLSIHFLGHAIWWSEDSEFSWYEELAEEDDSPYQGMTEKEAFLKFIMSEVRKIQRTCNTTLKAYQNWKMGQSISKLAEGLLTKDK